MAEESKTEAPTEQRRKKAREEGRVAVSHDLAGGIALVAACAAARATWPRTLDAMAQATAGTILAAHPEADAGGLVARAVAPWGSVAVSALLPVVLAAGVVGIVANLAQTRLLFSVKALQPNPAKLNPLDGLKRVVSIRGMVETAKSALKVLIVLIAGGLVVWSRREDINRLASSDVGTELALTVELCLALVMRCAVALTILGAADYAYRWWETEKQLRMSHQEIKDELKQQEGDPQMRARRRSLRRAMAKQGISRQMPQATVVVTNPTHIAVALRYTAGMPAPQVVAKGRHLLAARIVRLARRYNVPIIQNITVARALYRDSAVGGFVPGALFQAVAEILAVVYRQASRRKARHTSYLA
jgi:flagellar biosynthesis protein FlhB